MPFSQETHQNTTILRAELSQGPGARANLPCASLVPDEPKATPRRSSRKRMCSRYLDEDMITLEDSSLWSPVLSRALQERYGDSGRKRTPRTLTRLMQQHRENERHRHHGLNASIREISQRIPGFDEENKETKIVKLQRIINYICHLEHSIKKVCDDIGFTLDYKNLFLSPHITRNPDDWKPITKQPSVDDQYRPRQYTALCLKQHLEDKELTPPSEDSSPDHLLPQNLPPGSSCGHSPTPKRPPAAAKKRPVSKARGKSLRAKGNGAQRSKVINYNVPGDKPGIPTQDPREGVLLPGIALDGDGHAWLNQNLGEDDLAWLDRMMESSTTDMDPMCHVALPLPDLLPELPTPTYSPSAVISWDNFSNPTPSYSDVAEFHSYARSSQNENEEALSKDMGGVAVETPEDHEVCPPTLPSDEPGCLMKELLQPSKNDQENINYECSDGALLFDAAEKGEAHISPLQPYVSMEETVLTSGEIKLEDTGYAVVSGKRTERPRVDLRKTSWMNGFMMYSRIHRKRYIEENPGIHTSHISRLMGQDWRKLSFSAQQPYRDKARLHIQNHLAPQLVPNFKRKKTTR